MEEEQQQQLAISPVRRGGGEGGGRGETGEAREYLNSSRFAHPRQPIPEQQLFRSIPTVVVFGRASSYPCIYPAGVCRGLQGLCRGLCRGLQGGGRDPWEVWRSLGAILGAIEQNRGEHLSGPPRRGPKSRLLGPSWSLLGPSWASLGPLLGLSWAILGPSGGLKSPSEAKRREGQKH